MPIYDRELRLIDPRGAEALATLPGQSSPDERFGCHMSVAVATLVKTTHN
jgi:hypothetical protein